MAWDESRNNNFAADLVAFVRNATVTRFDREDVLNRILGGTPN